MAAVLSTLISILKPLLAFILILVPLVVFHEFGHFIFARIFGVKAEVFSVGFGPKLWSRQWGETEFRLSAIPMGGFVKLLGEDREAEVAPADRGRALHEQKPWKRFFIFFGGPLFNFILAILIFMVILVIGEPQLASVVGRVVHGSAAERVGFKSGDQILEVDHHLVTKFEEVAQILSENPNRQIDFKVIHRGDTQPVSIQVQTTSESGLGSYGESAQVGQVEGLLPFAREPQVGVSDPHSKAAQAGVGTGDQITRLDGKTVKSWEDLEADYLSVSPGSSITLELEKPKSATEGKKRVEWKIEKPLNSQGIQSDLGLYSSELFIDKVVPKSPAEKMGLKPGDRLIGVSGVEVQSFFQLRENVQKFGERDHRVQLKWERAGQITESSIEPTATLVRDVSLNKKTNYTVGIVPNLALAEPSTVIERVLNPIQLLFKASERMVQLTWKNLVSLRKMAMGEVSMGQLGGPLTMGKIAGESLARGLIVFLTNMAIFSIGLGVLNILPVPVLDGGHLFLLGLEILRGKPLSLRQMEIAQGLGLLFILALMGIAFHNDIARLIYS